MDRETPSSMLGELIVARGLISRTELDALLAEESATGKRLSEIVVRKGFASAAQLMSTLVEQLGVEILSADNESRTAKPDFERLDLELAQDDAPSYGDPSGGVIASPLRSREAVPLEESRPEEGLGVKEELLEIRKAQNDIAEILTAIRAEIAAIRHETAIGFA